MYSQIESPTIFLKPEDFQKKIINDVNCERQRVKAQQNVIIEFEIVTFNHLRKLM